MFTLCPQCETVHALDARRLATAGGRVSCARCDITFQALDALYDQYPDHHQQPFKRQHDAAPPEVGSKPVQHAPMDLSNAPKPLDQPGGRPWVMALAILGLFTVINLAWTATSLIPRDGELAETLQRWSIPGFEAPPAFRDPSRIHLLTRDMHEHPTLPGVLVLSATFTNLADEGQPYPDVMVALKNSDDRTLAARVFEPADYLVASPGADALLATGEQVPLLLEFADPGELATGFELTFR